MTTIFIGGSRRISRLPAEVRARLDNVMASGHSVVVGDAMGADKAAQAHLHAAGYPHVTVYGSGASCRNNLGQWPCHLVRSEDASKRGFQMHAEKDRAMATVADFGLMIWDGESPGTLLNVLRLVRAGRIAVLFHVPERRAVNVKTAEDWHVLIGACSPEVVDAAKRRALTSEWLEPPAPSVADPLPAGPAPAAAEDALTSEINAALARGDLVSVMETLNTAARARGLQETISVADGVAALAAVMNHLSSVGMRPVVTRADQAGPTGH